jgi:hypothetical protein
VARPGPLRATVAADSASMRQRSCPWLVAAPRCP